MSKKTFFFLLSSLFLIYSNAQCAMCRAVLESEESQSAAQGINDGIIYLMAIPYIIVGCIGYFLYRAYGKSPK